MNPKFYNPNFVHVKPRIPAADFELRKPHEPKDKIFRVPECMSLFPHCSQDGRKKTKDAIKKEKAAI